MKKGPRPKYNWDDIFSRADGQWITLTKGKDFHCTLLGFHQQIRSRATDRGIIVSVSFAGDTALKLYVGRRV